MNALKPIAPSRHWPAISGIDGAVSAPQSPKSTTTLRARHLALLAVELRRRDGRIGERVLDHGRDPAGGGGHRAGREVLALGVARDPRSARAGRSRPGSTTRPERVDQLVGAAAARRGSASAAMRPPSITMSAAKHGRVGRHRSRPRSRCASQSRSPVHAPIPVAEVRWRRHRLEPHPQEERDPAAKRPPRLGDPLHVRLRGRLEAVGEGHRPQQPRLRSRQDVGRSRHRG